jgi:NADH:ubiquinone oxidoreductase subunit E
MPSEQPRPVGAALVVGGGIGGMQAALDLAGAGIKVYLAEKKPAIGGVMAQLDKTFPTNDCAMCTMAPRLVEIGRHPDIHILSMSEVQRVEGQAGNFVVTLAQQPRFVDEAKCTGCGSCVENCPTRNLVQPSEVPKAELELSVRETVSGIIARNVNRQGPLMPILQEVNEAFNYFPDGVLKYIAEEMACSLAHIYRVATFYSAFSIAPRGKYVINVCMGTTCYVRGSERLMEKISDVLGVEQDGTTADMNFTLKSVRCLGCCGLAPALTVGSEVHGKLTRQQIPDILRKYQQATQHA